MTTPAESNYYLKLRLLHIEDDEIVRSTVKRLLRRVSYADVRLVSVTTLTEGLEQLQDYTWDCVLLDLCLPDCSGISTFHHVHAVADIPVVVLTAEPSLEERAEVIAAGAQDCLYKPELKEPDTLLRSIRFAVERHHSVIELLHALQELERANRVMSEILARNEFTYSMDEDDDDGNEDERH